MKTAASLLVTLLAVVGASVFFMNKRAAQPMPGLELSLYFTCDIRGRLVPCGCFTGQHGGMTRLKTVLDNEAGGESLRLDVGDAVEGAADFHYIEYRHILKAFQLMHYDALNLGQREAQLSLQQLQSLKSAGAPLISANVMDSKTGEPVFPPYTIVERKGRKVGILGLVDPKGMEEPAGAGIMIERMEAVLSKRLPELRAKTDIIVLLAFTDEATLSRLAREFYELDVILGGKVSQPAQQLVKENRSLIYYTANESRTIAHLKFKVASNPRVTAVTNEIALLYADIPENEEVKTLADAYREEIRKTRLVIDQPELKDENAIPGVRQAAAYAGSENCIACHPSAAKVWSESAHAHAFGTLKATKADADPNCISCHTVGFGTPSGYLRVYADKKLTNVGCESCHGPGSLHVEQRTLGLTPNFKFRPLGAGDCIQCHHGEFSRPFDWEKFWPHIKHGKEPALKSVAGAKP